MIYVARVLDLCGAGAPARDCRQRRAADIRLLALRKYSALKNDSILEKDSPSTKRLALGWRSAFSAANEVVFYARAFMPGLWPLRYLYIESQGVAPIDAPLF